ncbi:hypothetical protein [Pseudonocardia nigra]|uniref:hypothetical protein n=1 Tax=Pseudonocardia nigra TaxID=1921578 RepID=UPI001C5E1770|nr:hypothetical protein [Pseudonocardia nigra]
MTEFTTFTAHTAPRTVVRDREGIAMLLHEALARSRQQEAQRAAREYTLARQFTAGRRWDLLAGFAARRAAHARAGLGSAPLAASVSR